MIPHSILAKEVIICFGFLIGNDPNGLYDVTFIGAYATSFEYFRTNLDGIIIKNAVQEGANHKKLLHDILAIKFIGLSQNLFRHDRLNSARSICIDTLIKYLEML